MTSDNQLQRRLALEIARVLRLVVRIAPDAELSADGIAKIDKRAAHAAGTPMSRRWPELAAPSLALCVADRRPGRAPDDAWPLRAPAPDGLCLSGPLLRDTGHVTFTRHSVSAGRRPSSPSLTILSGLGQLRSRDDAHT